MEKSVDKIEKGKSKLGDDIKNPTKEISKTPNKKENSPKKFNTIDNSYPNSFPKNVNQFRHILEDIKCCGADIEFMLQLRRYKQIKNLESALNTPLFIRTKKGVILNECGKKIFLNIIHNNYSRPK